mmetsp:Transcript_11410/g.33796  ORF Transcript_11410/g.33796 Transcript_11410/m.33796 type:complete len:101 (-) Transcript_11410:564-866(-)|eukprot:CAMPEP_0206032780 /NCGR_PEP_ID=MMETSP1466-20131121/191_1 /ASSEMBLY_ACC=CAM_ASM_001126 /TAXON_ID=44452 /ORGANISM="Pavlova gyrans, Strain CCMP608" /LENGTH=100 /DNA_ID=CAMNT_0053406927 /DNA_START=50 /DNA_END=352 /DNA_ORIENTATION=+
MAAAQKGGSFLGDMGRKFSVGADAAGKGIKAQALKAEIMMKESQIKSIKQELGVAIYPSLEAGDQAETSRLFNEYKGKVDAINAEIAAKKMEVQELATPR